MQRISFFDLSISFYIGVIDSSFSRDTKLVNSYLSNFSSSIR